MRERLEWVVLQLWTRDVRGEVEQSALSSDFNVRAHFNTNISVQRHNINSLN